MGAGIAPLDHESTVNFEAIGDLPGTSLILGPAKVEERHAVQTMELCALLVLGPGRRGKGGVTRQLALCALVEKGALEKGVAVAVVGKDLYEQRRVARVRMGCSTTRPLPRGRGIPEELVDRLIHKGQLMFL